MPEMRSREEIEARLVSMMDCIEKGKRLHLPALLSAAEDEIRVLEWVLNPEKGEK